MKSYKKIFARKLTALFLSIVMIASTFTGVLTVFAAEKKDFHDDGLAANFMAWAETTDEQTAEALLDWVDLNLGNLLVGLLGSDEIHFKQSIVVATIQLDLYLDSIDGLIDAVRQANDLLSKYGGLIGGDVNNINLSALPSLSYTQDADKVVSKCGKSYRANNSAKDIIMALAKTLYQNTNDNGGKNVIGNFFKGGLSLGSILEGVLGGNVYGILKDKVFNTSLHLNLWDGYQSNLVYNIVAELILHLTDWYTDAEVASFESYLQGKGGTKWNFDDELFKKLSTELLAKINVEVTYPGNLSHEVGAELKDTSRTRYQKIQEYIAENGGDIRSASVALGYDPDLHYTDDGNVYILQYGYDSNYKVLSVNKDSKLLEIAQTGLGIAWKTVLEPTIGIVHVNYDVDRGHGANFDNEYYYWMRANKSWNTADWKSNYSKANVEAWAEAMYETYGAKDAQEFLGYVENTFEYDRTVKEDATNDWHDIDPTTLFNKLRYNPLADLYFNMQTGPINLYFMQTGAENISKFFNQDYSKYTDIIHIVNDVLVAAVKDFFPESDNIAGSLPELATTFDKLTGTKAENNKTIANTLVSNALKVFTYAANAADENILNPFYTKNGKIALTEGNFEEAMIPLLIACLQRIEFADMIHDEKWDACADAEGVAYVALEEYLSYVLPNKDYEQLVSKQDGKYVVELADIEVMARDAVGYLLSSIVPCRDKNGNEWNVYTSDPVKDTTTIYEILNSVVCYYAGMDNYVNYVNGVQTATTGKGVAALLGVVDGNGNCQVTINKTLWQNIDAIANKCLPILGTVITGTKGGKIDSYDLLYNKIIKGILDIGPNKGVTTILEQILTIFNSDPMNKGIDKMVYDDILADTINALFGARDSRQGYKKVVPNSSDMGTDTPFDSFVSANVFARYSYTDNKQNGVLGLLISNIYEFFGGNYPNYSTDAMRKGCWTGAMFAVKAVNNFIPSFVPQLTEHKFGAATVTIPNASRNGVVPGQKVANTYLEFKNNSIGLNRFWRDSTGTVQRDKRYFFNITDVSLEDEKGVAPSNINVSAASVGVVAPETTVKIPVSGQYISGTQLIRFTVTYDIFEGEGNPKAPASEDCLYSGLKATAYLYLSSEQSWENSFYTGTNDSGVRFGNEESNTTKSNTAGTVYLNVFNTFIMSSANPDSVESAGLPITSKGNGGVDAVFNYISDDSPAIYVTEYEMPDEKTDRAEIDEPELLAYASFDKTTHDLINIYRKDMFIDGDWDDNGGAGYTENEVNSYLEENKDADGVYPNVEVRNHIACTLEDGINDGIVTGVDMDDNGHINHIFVNPAYIADGSISPTTQVAGLDMISYDSPIQISDTTVWTKWLRYDGLTNIAPQSFKMNLAAINSAGIMKGKVNFVIANDAEAGALMNQYNAALKEMASYDVTDFKDYEKDEESGFASSDTYDKLQKSYQNVVKAISTPVTLSNAASLDSTFETVAVTSQTTSTMGDIAYVPSGEYLDDAHTMPIYTNDLLTDSDVVAGKDAAGQAVIKGDDGNYYLANAVSYKYAWNIRGIFKDAPYYGKTTTPAVDEEGNALYDRVQYQFIDADGNNVGAGDNWVKKYAITESRIKESTSTVDYRGYYQKQMDSLNYWMDEAKANINTALAANVGVGIIEDRQGLNNVNYDVATYEKMVQIAKAGEKLVSSHEEEDEEGNKVTVYSTTASSVEINEALRVYNIYKSRTIKRPYQGDAINKEILCATGAAYDTFKGTTEATEEAAAVVKTTANSVRFGAVKNGVLVNEGDIVYTAKSWNAYIEALAHAAVIANEKTAELTSTYGAKKELQIAENNLEIENSITVTGTVFKAGDAKGATAVKSAPVAGAEIRVDGEVVATTEADGTFTATISKDTEEIVVTGEAVIDRTIAVSGEQSIAGAEVCVIAFDFDENGIINTIDATLATKNGGVSTKDEVAAFKNIFNKKIAYQAVTLD